MARLRAGRHHSSPSSGSGRTTVTTISQPSSTSVGWAELWSDPELLGPAVAGGIELGRAVAPLCLVDEATLGAPLALGGRVRHGAGRVEGGEREPTLDGTGTLRGVAATPSGRGRAAYRPGAPSRSRISPGSPTVHSSKRSSTHGSARAVRGAARRPAGRAGAPRRCSACARRVSSSAPGPRPTPDAGFPASTLAWAGAACREVTMHVQQVHGGIGFALEGGIHRYFRRAKTVQVWTDALLRELSPYRTAGERSSQIRPKGHLAGGCTRL